MLPLRIALRFLRTSKLQSGLIIAGIAVGIALQVFVGSLITSLQASLLNTTIGTSPHITIQAKKQGDPIVYNDKIRRALADEPALTTIVPIRSAPVLYSSASNTAPLTLQGGELAQLDTIYDVSARVYIGKPKLGTGDILVGKEFSDTYGVLPGDTLQLILPKGQIKRLEVTGVFDLGAAAANERTAFVTGSFAAAALGYTSEQYTAVQMQVVDVFGSTAITGRLRSKAALANDKVVDWQEQNADLLTALQSQGSSSYMIQVFVLIAVALGIASTLAISAVQKTRQIGILKAMGMSDRQAALIFLWEAILLGFTGTALGIGSGVGLIALFSLAPLTFTVSPQPTFIAVSAAVGMTVALLSAIIPARSTSRLDPIEVIQGG